MSALGGASEWIADSSPGSGVVRGAGHVDLYDRVGLMSFDRLEGFFADALV